MNTASSVSGLPAAFGFGASELAAIVGGGGKTSLMFGLANSLGGATATTTTTRIFAAQISLSPAVLYAPQFPVADPAFLPALQAHLERWGQCLIVGEARGEKAFGAPPQLPGWLLAQPEVDHVIIEADGSRMLPIKAPADHEPVVPPETTLLIPTMGIDALDSPIAEIAHRPDRVEALIGKPPNGRLTSNDAAILLTHPQGGAKNAPPAARIVPFINKVETETQFAAARRIAKFALQEPRIERVVIGALKPTRRSPLAARRLFEVHRRVTAVILAAGAGSRMGESKLTLPWGDGTVLGQTLANVEQSLVYDRVVVSGHHATAVNAIAAQQNIPVVHNENYAAGEMILSLQTAVRQLPDDITAVLVVLGDQPLVSPSTIDALLVAYWRGEGSIVAPAVNGRRGNPVLIDRKHFTELLALPPNAAPRALLKRHPVCRVSVKDQAILQDLDDRSTYERLRPA